MSTIDGFLIGLRNRTLAALRASEAPATANELARAVGISGDGRALRRPLAAILAEGWATSEKGPRERNGATLYAITECGRAVELPDAAITAGELVEAINECPRPSRGSTAIVPRAGVMPYQIGGEGALFRTVFVVWAPEGAWIAPRGRRTQDVDEARAFGSREEAETAYLRAGGGRA